VDVITEFIGYIGTMLPCKEAVQEIEDGKTDGVQENAT